MKKTLTIFSILVIGCQGKVPCYLGNHLYLDYDRNSYFSLFEAETINSGSRGVVLEGDIIEINCDSIFIVALVKPVYKISAIVDPNSTLNMVDEDKLISKSKIRKYWIVNKKMKSELKQDEKGNYYISNVYGPFNKMQYLKKRKEIGISDTLQLKSVMKFLE